MTAKRKKTPAPAQTPGMLDRAQKEKALHYSIARRWLPQLELDVAPMVITGPAPTLITDVDVFASVPDEFEGYQQVLFDCKSGSRESAIGRALWLRGLMHRLGAARGICILKGTIGTDHRLAAAGFNVTLVQEDELAAFATATGGAGSVTGSYLAKLENWDRQGALAKQNEALADLVRFSRAHFWGAGSASLASRQCIALLLRHRGDLDPAKPMHLGIFGDICALFLHALSRVAVSVFYSYIHPRTQEDLADSVRYLLYGGRDNYNLLNSLRQRITPAPEGSSEDLTVPQWERFLNLLRQSLNSPRDALRSALVAREVAWSFFDAGRTEPLTFAAELAKEAPHAAKICLLAAEYLARAARLSPEFGKTFSDAFVALVPTGAALPAAGRIAVLPPTAAVAPAAVAAPVAPPTPAPPVPAPPTPVPVETATAQPGQGEKDPKEPTLPGLGTP